MLVRDFLVIHGTTVLQGNNQIHVGFGAFGDIELLNYVESGWQNKNSYQTRHGDIFLVILGWKFYNALV